MSQNKNNIMFTEFIIIKVLKIIIITSFQAFENQNQPIISYCAETINWCSKQLEKSSFTNEQTDRNTEMNALLPGTDQQLSPRNGILYVQIRPWATNAWLNNKNTKFVLLSFKSVVPNFFRFCSIHLFINSMKI